MAKNDPKDKKEIDAVSGVETTGHEWDGLKELNNPAPRWWVWVFLACVIFSIGYWYVYPTWPTLTGHSAGAIKWTEYEQLKQGQAEIEAMRSKYETRFSAASLQDIQNDRELYAYAVAGGAVAFKNNCAACHGAGAQGSKGYPNLNDDNWIWGGSLDQIYATIKYGVHNENAQSRSGANGMPAWKDSLSADDINAVATYAAELHQGDKADKSAEYTKGETLFAANCVACHGEGGVGNVEMGAPALKNGIFQWGGDHATLVETISYGRKGVMPVWDDRLSDSTIKQLAVYVHSLGGGK